MGYSGISPSAAFAINIFSSNTPGIALRTNGTLPTAGGYTPTTPVSVASGNPIFMSLLYVSNVLSATLVESNTPNVYTTSFAINLPSVLGSQTAFVGFTGADGGFASTQVVSNLTYIPLTPVSIDSSNSSSLVFTGLAPSAGT